MNAITPPGDDGTGWLARTTGLRLSDGAAFIGDVRVCPVRDVVFALHRDAEMHELGWECHHRAPDDRIGVRYRKGLPKGIVCTPPRGCTRLVVTEGALSAIAAAALLQPGSPRTCIGGIGGAWNERAAMCVEGLLVRTEARRVEIAIDTHLPALRAMRDQAVADLAAEGLGAIVLDPPPGGWLATLRQARGGQMRHERWRIACHSVACRARGVASTCKVPRRRPPASGQVAAPHEALRDEARAGRGPPLRALRPLA